MELYVDGALHLRAIEVVERWKQDTGRPMLSPADSGTLAHAILEAMVWARELGPQPDRRAYEAYVAKCHITPGLFVTEFGYEDWVAAGKPEGPR